MRTKPDLGDDRVTTESAEDVEREIHAGSDPKEFRDGWMPSVDIVVDGHGLEDPGASPNLGDDFDGRCVLDVDTG